MTTFSRWERLRRLSYTCHDDERLIVLVNEGGVVIEYEVSRRGIKERGQCPHGTKPNFMRLWRDRVCLRPGISEKTLKAKLRGIG